MAEVMTDTHGIDLPQRYVIRRLDFSVRDWVIAMGIEGFMLRDASLWKPILPHPKTANALRALEKLAGHYEHALASGLCFGIFDTAYVFSRPDSAATGRMLHWRGATSQLDPGRPEFETYGAEQMRAAMDFPLVCVALSFDAFTARDPHATRDMLDLIPLQAQLGSFLTSVTGGSSGKGKDIAAVSTPTGFGQVLVRSGCVTRVGYERQGLATALNRFVMLEAKAWGFRGIKVGMGSETMLRCWMNPPQGCTSQIVAHFDFEEIEMVDEDGNPIRPYLGSGMKDGYEVWCDLTG
ncbi:hypothetical protein F5Y16DRAFT_4988 [Xylariaceae sp. FL0255]|nr:hypothetical protein F5Y16DRAFT_4988 [Xylariaceae sp. FL0255]